MQLDVVLFFSLVTESPHAKSRATTLLFEGPNCSAFGVMFMVATGELLWFVVVVNTWAAGNQLYSIHGQFMFVDARPGVSR
jgi:hypothetical protein